jgi:mercuric ion transport protein
LLAAVGLSAALGYLDYVLIPAMLMFVGITVYAVLKHRKHA